MARRVGRPRHLVVGRDRFLWRLAHAHEHWRDERGGPHYVGCREVVTIRQNGLRGRLDIVFRASAGHLVSDHLLHLGAVVRVDRGVLNLHEPGVVRALLDEALACGWQADAPARLEIDGWTLFDAVFARRSDAVDG